ncbi:hypothetical protein [Hymenobacter coccineus]|nr:hypothetical protein [Hymenobacter coccineus]
MMTLIFFAGSDEYKLLIDNAMEQRNYGQPEEGRHAISAITVNEANL